MIFLLVLYVGVLKDFAAHNFVNRRLDETHEHPPCQLGNCHTEEKNHRR